MQALGILLRISWNVPYLNVQIRVNLRFHLQKSIVTLQLGKSARVGHSRACWKAAGSISPVIGPTLQMEKITTWHLLYTFAMN